MILHDAKDQFYQELYRKIDNKEIHSNEFIDFIVSNSGTNPEDNTSGFYELCSKFSDISLNAIKKVDPKTCDVQACFQFKDSDVAKAAFKKYTAEKKLSDYEGILDAIGLVHWLAVAWDDPRQKSGLIQPQGRELGSPFYGKYHNFCELPEDVWKQIRAEIVNEMNGNLKEE